MVKKHKSKVQNDPSYYIRKSNEEQCFQPEVEE